jgi:hypothetical protein
MGLMRQLPHGASALSDAAVAFSSSVTSRTSGIIHTSSSSLKIHPFTCFEKRQRGSRIYIGARASGARCGTRGRFDRRPANSTGNDVGRLPYPSTPQQLMLRWAPIARVHAGGDGTDPARQLTCAPSLRRATHGRADTLREFGFRSAVRVDPAADLVRPPTDDLRRDARRPSSSAGTSSLPPAATWLWSPTIRAALIAGTPWLDVFCPGCGTSRRLIFDRSTAIPSRRSLSSCSGCGALGVQSRRRCRGSSVCTRSRQRRRPRRRICDLETGRRRRADGMALSGCTAGKALPAAGPAPAWPRGFQSS